MMELIQSFSVDHTKIIPGIFTSRVDTVGDGTVTTYDIRLKKPNREPVIDVAAMHSLEHIIATYLRKGLQQCREESEGEDRLEETLFFYPVKGAIHELSNAIFHAIK